MATWATLKLFFASLKPRQGSSEFLNIQHDKLKSFLGLFHSFGDLKIEIEGLSEDLLSMENYFETFRRHKESEKKIGVGSLFCSPSINIRYSKTFLAIFFGRFRLQKDPVDLIFID